MLRNTKRLAVASLAFTVAAGPLAAQQSWAGRPGVEHESCTTASGAGAEWLERGARSTGIAGLTGAVRFSATETHVQAFQSDRMYPPFIQATSSFELTFDPATASERARGLTTNGTPGRDLIRAPRALFAVRDTQVVAAPNGFHFFEGQRPLNPLAILAEWRTAQVSVVARCVFRDFPRVVLSRGVAGERLYVDGRTGVPVKYERTEPHVLWGQVHVEYVYATWWTAGPVTLPMVAVRYEDGVEEYRRDLLLPQARGEQMATAVARGDAYPRPLPDPLPDHAALPDQWLRPVPVDTIRVAANTFLLRTGAYTHAVTMVRDTVYLLDATTAEWRSQADSAWLATLFPRHRAVVLVVTDLAWPHISGVRYWAARGATIATHRMSRPFLQQVLSRTWTLEPDLLSRSPAALKRLRWITVDSAASLAGGAIRLQGIDGVSSEGALMALLPDGFLWAGDYIQDAAEPSAYASEVMAAAQRAGFTPQQVAAQHLPLTPWSTILAANPPH